MSWLDGGERLFHEYVIVGGGEGGLIGNYYEKDSW